MPYKDKTKRKKFAAAHYLDNKHQYKKNKNKGDTLRQKCAVINAIKEASPCADCGKNYPYFVMDFDHVSHDKRDGVSRLVRNASMEEILSEIKKCEVVCSNCHRFRTHLRRKNGLERNFPLPNDDQGSLF